MPSYARVPALAALALVLLAVLTGGPPTASATARLAARAPGAPPSGGPGNTFKSVRTYDQVAVPTRLRIPALHVDTKIERLGLRTDGTIQVPATTDIAGWYEYGPRPGQAGPAVLLGHVDSTAGPGIFFDLYRVKPGTAVQVERSDGTSATFSITKVQRVPKVRFPTDLVYAATLDPTLRLVTCGGSFDHSRRSYRDNVIAFAEPA